MMACEPAASEPVLNDAVPPETGTGAPRLTPPSLNWTEPEADRSAREMLARAQFDSHRYVEAADNFGQLVSRDPSDHYAHFGLGLAARRMGDLDGAVEHLALAAAMRPDLGHYTRALHAARAARSTMARGKSDES